MVGRGKSPASSSDEPGADRSPSVREMADKFEGVYHHTRTRSGAIPPVDYWRLDQGVEPDEEHSAIAESQSSSSFGGPKRAAYTTESTDDLKKKLEEYQVVMQENMRAQQEALRAQQESIDQLREMMAQIIADRAQFHTSGTKPQPESSQGKGRPSKGKEKVVETSDQGLQRIDSSSEDEGRAGDEPDPQSLKMDELEARLNAIANRSELQNEGVVRPYPAEWDTAPYPPKFKAPTLQAFDGKGSPNQHVYYFKSQTGDVVANDAILTRLFIGTLKGVAFEWFMKLPAGSIHKWADLERLFLARFFEDDTEVSVPTLLSTRQRKGESIKSFVERFRSTALRCPSGMTQATLVETCRHNLQTQLLARMGVAGCHSWKQLVSQGEQAEAIVARIEAEETGRHKQSTQLGQGHAFQSRRKDAHATKTSVRASPTKQGKPSNQSGTMKQYSFKEEHIDTLFQLLRRSNKLKLPEIQKPDEAGKVDDPNYCRYHRMLGHSTKRCHILKDILQALVDAEVLKLKPEQKTVSTNMTSVRFGDFPPVATSKRGLRLNNFDPHGQEDNGGPSRFDQRKAGGSIPEKSN